MIYPGHLHGRDMGPVSGTASWFYAYNFPCDVCGNMVTGSFYTSVGHVVIQVTNEPHTTLRGLLFLDPNTNQQIHGQQHYCTQQPGATTMDISNLNYKLDQLLTNSQQILSSLAVRENTTTSDAVKEAARLQSLVELLQDKIAWLQADLETEQKRSSDTEP